MLRSLRWLGSIAFVGVSAITLFPACTSTANISEVWTALDGDGVRRRDVFYTDSIEIHCLAQAGIGRPNVTIEAFIHQLVAWDFSKPPDDPDAEQPRSNYYDTDRYLGYVEIKPEPNKNGPVLIDLSLGRNGPDGKPKDDAPFEAGSYVCEIMLDGEIQGTKAFNITFPPCPPAFIIPNGPCFKFYWQGKQCPRYGNLSDDPATCTCSIENGWECDG